ncbi:tetratricopeptide repeat protein [Caenibacillus caldisaponilyticus]|uniref:tetratricopeptide repeat protein n=1 Tax=Caenibacillus caldisaponilyticus TaxID=1674942 RepID=UPI0009885D0E|nr:tetratricopeptide repeat protein [Caenibacillus caldisaponilyticus]
MKQSSPRGGGAKIIPFPHLQERLLEKAVDALKQKQHVRALELFEQLADIDEQNPQAAYGLAVCYVELGRYTEAVELTKKMMEEGIGDYFDVLKLHITVLIQLRQYREVVALVRAVLEESDVPTDLRQHLMQLAAFAVRRLDEKHREDQKKPAQESDETELFKGSREQQWRAFYQMRKRELAIVERLYRKYLLHPQGDPVLKSVMLAELKERGLKGRVEVEKFGTHCQADMSEPLFYETFGADVRRRLQENLASDNPTLFHLAAELWDHFTIAAFPLPLVPAVAEIWAAASFVFASRLNGRDVESEEITARFSIDAEDIEKPLSMMTLIENESEPAPPI